MVALFKDTTMISNNLFPAYDEMQVLFIMVGFYFSFNYEG
jgi:hypothetical protein